MNPACVVSVVKVRDALPQISATGQNNSKQEVSSNESCLVRQIYRACVVSVVKAREALPQIKPQVQASKPSFVTNRIKLYLSHLSNVFVVKSF